MKKRNLIFPFEVISRISRVGIAVRSAMRDRRASLQTETEDALSVFEDRPGFDDGSEFRFFPVGFLGSPGLVVRVRDDSSDC